MSCDTAVLEPAEADRLMLVVLTVGGWALAETATANKSRVNVTRVVRRGISSPS